jgi:hypothetical protein
MTDQDQDKDQDLTKLGIRPADVGAGFDADVDPDVEGHAAGRPVRATEDEDDVEGHFSTVRSTRSKGD